MRPMSWIHQLRRRLRERLAPDQPALAPAGLVGGEEGAEHRTAERRVAGCGVGLDHQLEPGAAGVVDAAVAAQQERRDRDVGVAQRRADHRAGDTGAPTERHGVLAAKVGPEVALASGQLGPETGRQGADQQRVAGEQVDRGAGPLAHEAAHQSAGAVHPDIARERHGVERCRRSRRQGPGLGPHAAREDAGDQQRGGDGAARHGAQCDRDRAGGEGCRSHVIFIHFAPNLGSPQRLERQ